MKIECPFCGDDRFLSTTMHHPIVNKRRTLTYDFSECMSCGKYYVSEFQEQRNSASLDNINR